MNQREACFTAISALRAVTNPMTLTYQEKHTTVETLCKMFQSGSVDLKSDAEEKLSNPAKLKSYVVGLLNDFLRKDKRVNGGVSYESKNPGSRAGNQDDTVREMRKLLKVQTEPAAIELIEKEIAERVASLQVKKTVTPKIDYSKIPANIMALITK